MVRTPVLFVTFARPEYARQTFDSIKKAKPAKLYFYSNKARESNMEETERNDQIRSFVNEIDWDCELKTFLRDEYVDIYTSLWSAFDWIFDNEEQAIILEEDCVPSKAFFDFCDQMINSFKDDPRIWVVSGNNFIEGYNPNGYDYFFSYFPFMYGWASWRDRWHKIIRGSLPYEKIREYRLFDQIYADRQAAKSAVKFTERIKDTPAWDYRLTISMKCNGGFGIIPKVNLVSNIGLTGTHNEGRQSIFHQRPLPGFEKYVINNPPPFIVPDFGYSKCWYDSYYLKRKKFLNRIMKKVRNIKKK